MSEILNGIPRYSKESITTDFGDAVVVGGSIGGLVAARVLSDAFTSVTVVEKDKLPNSPSGRRGTPQDIHPHLLMQSGQRILSDFFEGFEEKLSSEEGVKLSWSKDMNAFVEGEKLAEEEKSRSMYFATRHLYEYLIREFVKGIDNIYMKEECNFIDFISESSSVNGIKYKSKNGSEEHINAELVVDATGRTSSTPDWLKSNGFGEVPTEEVVVDQAYSTVLVSRPSDEKTAYYSPYYAPSHRGGAVFPIENDRWVVSLQGIKSVKPPKERDEFLEYADSLEFDKIKEILEQQEWLSEIDYYPFPSNLRRRYEDLDEYPNGLIAIGDAVASFNPVYGQGMSVAFLECLQLHHVLSNSASVDDIPQSYFESISKIVDVPWNTAINYDSQFEEVENELSFKEKILSKYMRKVIDTAKTDEVVAGAYYEVVMMNKHPKSLLKPSIARRVLI